MADAIEIFTVAAAHMIKGKTFNTAGSIHKLAAEISLLECMAGINRGGLHGDRKSLAKNKNEDSLGDVHAVVVVNGLGD